MDGFPYRYPGGRRLSSGGGVTIALADGYQMIGTLHSDIVLYAVAARKHFDSAYLLGDLGIRDPDPALRTYGWLVGIFAQVLGLEMAFFALSLIGSVLILIGVYRLATRTLGTSQRTGFLAGVVGLSMTFGPFGYSLSLPSHAEFVPNPRFLSVAIAILAIGSVAEAALLRGVAFGLLATSINTLDGIVPVGLSLLALLLARTIRDWSEIERQRRVTSFLLALSVVVLLFAAGPTVALAPLGSTSALGVVGLGSVAVVAAWALSTRSSVMVSSRLRQLLLWTGAFAVGAILLARQRAVSPRGLWEGVVIYEGVLERVRVVPSMLELSSMPAQTGLLFVGLAIFTAAGALSLRFNSGAEQDGEAARKGTEGFLVTLTVLAVVFVAGGSVLLERTELPLLSTLWPVRTAWVVVLAAVLTGSVHLERAGIEVGLIPALALALLLLRGPMFGRVAWSACIVAIIGLLALRTVQPVDPSPRGRPARSGLLRRSARLGLSSLPVGFLLFALSGIAPPEIRVADSMERFILEGSGVEESVASMALTARSSTPLEARILVPPAPVWGAFRLMSERGVAFEWKAFSTAQPDIWYEQLRQMCDPSYRWNAQERYEIGGQQVTACHDGLGLEDILRVAEAFESTHAVVRAELAESAPELILGHSSRGTHALIRVP